ncbi:MAG: hypothetical protein CME36_07820 [unclassified Hahellaceae]|nr:hypothetical protein [Hahellaceae bacterium]|tara:strand:+ start:4431 stop:4808 length:378 start_codon:yes stop_codon:yes gene_type:complete
MGPTIFPIRRFVSFFLAALIALQSVLAIADVHKAHQSGANHLKFEHEHKVNNQPQLADAVSQNLEIGAVSQLDCHHCCHCHGSSPMFLADEQLTSDLVYLRGELLEYRVDYRSHIAFHDNPPPIA